MNVRGTLLQPRLSFFSTPPLPQSQIVSLILAGGSLESAQTRGAAGNVALGQGVAMLAQQYGSVVGIQEVGIESDINNETSLVLGRYLSPRLYVSYGISLTEQLNTFKLRYTLGDHWTIKAEVGQARARTWSTRSPSRPRLTAPRCRHIPAVSLPARRGVARPHALDSLALICTIRACLCVKQGCAC